MMFQRFPTHAGYDDPQLSNFYGMALPLLKQGVPVETVHIENLIHENTLKDIKVLIMSYANMKPLIASYHELLAKWVKAAGVLIYIGRDNDPFQNIKEWWNTGANHFTAPSQHLFKQMEIKEIASQQKYNYGKGKVFIIRQDPKELVVKENGHTAFLAIVKNAYQEDAKAGQLQFKNNFILNRGPYVIAAVLNEQKKDGPLTIKGTLIDLFDPELPVSNQKIVAPGTQAYLFNLDKIENKTKPMVLAAVARVYDEVAQEHNYQFLVKSPSNTNNRMRILLPGKPKSISASEAWAGKLDLQKNEWDGQSKTLLLGFENYNEGVQVKISW